MIVGDDEADAGEPALDQLAQQAGPARLGLLGADVDREQATMAIGSVQRTAASCRTKVWSTIGFITDVKAAAAPASTIMPAPAASSSQRYGTA